VCEPKVLLLDEPLAALDAKLRRAMQLELKKLQQRLGITFVFVTHDQDEAIVMSDRIAVINGGRIEQIGAAAEIYRKPATRFVADFLGQANLISVAIAERLAGGSLQMAASTTDRSGTTLLACVRPEKVVMESVAPAGDCIPFQVIEKIFRGPTTQYILAMPDGLTLTALAVQGGMQYQKGDRVFCRVDPGDVILLGD
jgi:spermidine/putrescine transport system ATP-binding protein